KVIVQFDQRLRVECRLRCLSQVSPLPGDRILFSGNAFQKGNASFKPVLFVHHFPIGRQHRHHSIHDDVVYTLGAHGRNGFVLTESEPIMSQPELRLLHSKYRTKRFNIPDFQQAREKPWMMMKNDRQLGDPQCREVRRTKPEKPPLGGIEFCVAQIILPFEPFKLPAQQEKVSLAVVALKNSRESKKQRFNLYQVSAVLPYNSERQGTRKLPERFSIDLKSEIRAQ